MGKYYWKAILIFLAGLGIGAGGVALFSKKEEKKPEHKPHQETGK
jgi:hypothetical protein